ncbi:dual specificity calcium/calmodulin-dependent 3',5'-cyclic nucleotide phosphodiesterase 1A-like isoform X2 [Macrobrachium rosenbergii]|uniref:dual specificity calcium/calmodulin-dependent 3',5'-cyclic nucleotide phosphodiesterase 1A-like isoform X2 n=1 Tax=Macrobrachium rosenbergii TaxID=79674 RepID=UPI0034D65AE7
MAASRPTTMGVTKENLHKSNSDPVRRVRHHAKGRAASVSKCYLTLDGYSYVIVASPPERKKDALEEAAITQPGSKNGQLAKQGSLTILRRSSSRSLSGRGSRVSSHSDDDLLDAADLAQDALPSADNPDACEKAALRLRSLLRALQKGEVAASVLQQNLQYAAEVLESTFLDDSRCEEPQDRAITISLEPSSTRKFKKASARDKSSRRQVGEEDDELSEVEPDAVPQEVREWLASTFTRQLSTARRRTDEKPKFRSVANAIRAGIFVERIYRRLSSATFLHLPPEVTKILKRVDDWDFNVWSLHEASTNTPLRCLSYELLNRYGLLHKFKMPPATLETFLTQVENGYQKFKNPYHNNVHAADVLQTMHYMLSQTGLMNWLNDIEILATLMAAIIHDYEHTGTTNNFHVMSGSETALLYNDRAVLENHHICAAFRLLRGEESNVLINLSKEEYREFRSLVIEMVLATDMSSHFQQIKALKAMLTIPDTSGFDKSKALSLVLHCCDISHPSKEWSLHERWTTQLLEEFFRQGDKERELGLPYSPLCDRNNTLVAESQIGFIDFIVEPSMAVCGDLLDKVAALSIPATPPISEEPQKQQNEPGGPIKRPVRPSGVVGTEVRRPWQDHLATNKTRWKERAAKDAELRAELALASNVNGDTTANQSEDNENVIKEEDEKDIINEANEESAE